MDPIMHWELMDSGTLSGKDNMELDAHLLAEMEAAPKHILRFYDWTRPSITYGHFIHPEDHLHLHEAAKLGVDIAKRPTGGGVICHFTDFTFSILVPKTSPYHTTDTLTNYCFINKGVKQALERLQNDEFGLLENATSEKSPLDRFCMAKPTVLDIMCRDLKVSGGAQRRTRHGFLHQGTISLTPPNWEWLQKIIRSKDIVDQMKAKSHYLPTLSKSALKQAIWEVFSSKTAEIQ